MSDYIKVLQNSLSDEDKKLLKRIYEPTVVCYPPHYAGYFLCVTDDGEIRYYSVIDKNEYADNKQRVYFASRDCGLSWKMHLVENDSIMGHAYKSEYSGRYFKFKSYNDDKRKGLYICFSNGFDDIPYEVKKISDYEGIHSRIIPLALKHKKRYIAFTEGWFGRRFTETAILYSDDDCETWNFVFPEIVPNMECKPPHMGNRWHNSNEPTIIEKDDGTLMMIVRTSQDYHYVYYSYDFGETWTKPEPTIFHGTLTMPTLYRLHDNRLMFFWNNTQPLPEIDKNNIMPPLFPLEKNGDSEDVFTNRDVNHAAISEDEGETWIGFREMLLNPVRNAADFRCGGGGYRVHDKSVHQIEVMELPFNKILVFAGQHEYCSRAFIFDIDWLYERSRFDNFDHGLINMSTQVYLKSVTGNFTGFSGHCSWNRTNGAIPVPDPDLDKREEVLFLSVTDDKRLVSNTQGAVWNFPASKQGEIEIKLRVCGRGLRISLTDRWINPIDEEIKNDAWVTYIATTDIAPNDRWTDVFVKWNTETSRYTIYTYDKVISDGKSDACAPYGMCYLHLQTVGNESDFSGSYVKLIKMKAE